MAGRQAKGYTGRLYHKQSLRLDLTNSAATTTTTVSRPTTTTSNTTTRTSASNRGGWYRRSMPAPPSNQIPVMTRPLVLKWTVLTGFLCNLFLHRCQLCTELFAF